MIKPTVEDSAFATAELHNDLDLPIHLLLVGEEVTNSTVGDPASATAELFNAGESQCVAVPDVGQRVVAGEEMNV